MNTDVKKTIKILIDTLADDLQECADNDDLKVFADKSSKAFTALSIAISKNLSATEIEEFVTNYVMNN